MGRTRNNQQRVVTEEKIRDLIRERLLQRQTSFPSERELSVRTGGSRCVIRKILEELEQKELLLRTANGRTVNPHANEIPVLFISRGRNMIDNPAWARLWLAFSSRFQGPLAPELYLMRYWPEELAEDLHLLAQKNAPYIIISSAVNLEPLLEKWRNEGKTVIFTDEAYLNLGFPVIALDNTKVGEIAADELFSHGFRHPALLAPNFNAGFNYSPYQNRITGFCNACRKLGMAFEKEHDLYEVIHQKGMLQNYIRTTTRIAEHPEYDSLFLSSDDQLPLVLEVLHDQQRDVPDSLGMITLNARNNAVTCPTRVTAISNATNEIAEALINSILAHFDGKISTIPTIAITPTIHKGETLCPPRAR